ncbi:hypothetical protein VCHC52A1_3782, partial [Vibrio cholerae HC-52A1]
MAASAP